MRPAEPEGAPVGGADPAAGDADAIAPDDATVISVRRRTTAAPVDDATVVSVRRGRGADQPDEPDDATVVSVRRGRGVDQPDEPDDATVVSVRRGRGVGPEAEDGTADDTVPSARARPGAVRRSAPAAEPASSGRTSPAVDTAPELEDTLLRPSAARAPGAEVQSAVDPLTGGGRAARIPDAAALRSPLAPRPIPPVGGVRAPAPARAPLPESLAAVPDHESVERAFRARDRRRVLVVVLAAAAVVVASAGALVFLLM